MEIQEFPVGSAVKRQAVRRSSDSWRQEGRETLGEKLGEILHDIPGRKGQYQAGEKLGRAAVANDLSDVLYLLRQKGLGRASVMQQSNSHLVIKVENCANCQVTESSNGCYFTAGYLAGALTTWRKSATTSVWEVSCGEYPGDTCVFMASW